MAQATPPGGPRLPCSPKQALTLYQVLFQRPAGLGQLQTALQQVHEGWDCPPGLELPMVLLEMEQSLRAQEKLLWDLELLTGVGLGLFWPPWARFCGQRDGTQHAWKQCSQSWGRNLNEDSEQLSSKLHPPPQAGEGRSESHQLLRGRQATDPLCASHLGEARSDADPRLEGPTMPAETAPGTPTGMCQEAEGAGCLHPGSSCKEPGNSELKVKGSEGHGQGPSQGATRVESARAKAVEDPGKKEERSQEEPNVPSSCGQTLRSPQEVELGQEAPGPSDLASQGLSASQDPPKGLGAGLSPERAESQTLLTDCPQGHPEKTPRGQRGPRGSNGESIRAQGKGAPPSQRERKQAQQGQEFKTPPLGEGRHSEVWGEAQGEATAWRQEEGDPQGHSGDFGSSPGKPIPQRVETGIPGPPGGSTPLTQAAAIQEGAWAPPPAAMPPAPPVLRGPGGGIPALGAQEPQPRLLGAPREQRGPRDPQSSKAAWPEPRSREDAPAGEEQAALQRLLELHRAAKERRRRAREQQRLRVLERLRILGNRHRRVHPLAFPPRAAPTAAQEDAAGWRHILRERLEHARRGGTQWLRALGARNTQNFQELLSPGTEEQSPGD